MPFKPGQSGNPSGRPKGCLGKFTTVKNAYIKLFEELGAEEGIKQFMHEPVAVEHVFDPKNPTGPGKKKYIYNMHQKKLWFYTIMSKMLVDKAENNINVTVNALPSITIDNKELTYNVGTTKPTITAQHEPKTTPNRYEV